MKVVKPSEVKLKSSTIVEKDEIDGAVWSASVTYKKDALVRKDTYTYKCRVDNVVGKDPATNYLTITDSWSRIGRTNPYKCLDDKIYTQTKGYAETETMVFTFNRCDAFALINVTASVIKITVTDKTDKDIDEVIFEEEYNMTIDLGSFSAYAYCYDPLSYQTDVFYTQIPLTIIGEVCVELTQYSDEESEKIERPSVGHVTCGRAHYLSEVLYNSRIEEADYSVNEVDEFGQSSLIVRESVPRGSFLMVLPRYDGKRVLSLMKSLRATPALWVCNNEDNDFPELLIWGVKEDWRIVYENVSELAYSLDIRGLI